MSFSVSWNSSSSFLAFFVIATFSFVLCRERLANRMFPKYGGTKVLMAALGSSLSSYFPELCDRPRGTCAFSRRTLWPRKVLFKNPTHDCWRGEIERRSHTKSRGQGCNGRCDCSRRSRRRSGHEGGEAKRKHCARTRDGREKART